MARSSNRVGVFTSHRGRKVKKVLLWGAVVVTLLFFGNGLRGGSGDDVPRAERQQEMLGGQQEEKDPTVAAPISRPFALPIPGGAQEVDSGDVYGQAVDRPVDDESETSGTSEDDEDDATDELQRSDSYRSAVQATTKFAEAYGTHSYEQTPEEWVESLPGLDAKAEKSLLESAKVKWPELVDRKSSSKASTVAQSITPIYSRDGGATIQLSVRVSKTTSHEGEAGYSADSYAVTLKQASSGSDWVIVAVS